MTNKGFEQINIRIAKKLGWKRFRMENTPEPLNTRRMTGLAPKNERNQFVPHFTTNLAYAMQLVDWATERDFNFKLVRYGKFVGDSYYAATFEYIGEQKAFDSAPIPSLAICKAFLKIK